VIQKKVKKRSKMAVSEKIQIFFILVEIELPGSKPMFFKHICPVLSEVIAYLRV
jgi:hypothetical protein